MEHTENMNKSELKAIYDKITGAQGLGPQYLDEFACRAVVLSVLHPGVTKCPRCGRELAGKKHQSFWLGKTVRCYCGRKFSARTGTALSGKAMLYREVVLLMFLIGLGLSDRRISEVCGCNRETVRLWRKDLGK